MPVQTEGSGINEIRSNITTARFNAWLRCGEVSHFHEDCLKFSASSQSRDSTNTVIDQMTHTLTANSPVTDVVLKSIERTNDCQGCKEKLQAKVSTNKGKCDINYCNSCNKGCNSN